MGMKFADLFALEIFLTNWSNGAGPKPGLCVGPAAWQYSLCTTGVIPLNEWLTVTFTYSGHVSKLNSMRVTYILPSGAEVVVSSRTNVIVDYGLDQSQTMAQTLNKIKTQGYDPSFYVMG